MAQGEESLEDMNMQEDIVTTSLTREEYARIMSDMEKRNTDAKSQHQNNSYPEEKNACSAYFTEPKSYIQAKSDPNWVTAMQKELDANRYLNHPETTVVGLENHNKRAWVERVMELDDLSSMELPLSALSSNTSAATYLASISLGLSSLIGAWIASNNKQIARISKRNPKFIEPRLSEGVSAQAEGVLGKPAGPRPVFQPSLRLFSRDRRSFSPSRRRSGRVEGDSAETKGGTVYRSQVKVGNHCRAEAHLLSPGRG
uniref:Uncharacterized protein n=1 Tax=Chenopodium quinoa TaxID=63459 RepID=A0A803LLN8_CHEQI